MTAEVHAPASRQLGLIIRGQPRTFSKKKKNYCNVSKMRIKDGEDQTRSVSRKIPNRNNLLKIPFPENCLKGLGGLICCVMIPLHHNFFSLLPLLKRDISEKRVLEPKSTNLRVVLGDL